MGSHLGMFLESDFSCLEIIAVQSSAHVVHTEDAMRLTATRMFGKAGKKQKQCVLSTHLEK